MEFPVRSPKDLSEKESQEFGKFHAFEHRITLTNFGLSWEATFCFIAEDKIRRNILGRIGWLDRVKLGLIDYEGKLLLSHYPEEY